MREEGAANPPIKTLVTNGGNITPPKLESTVTLGVPNKFIVLSANKSGHRVHFLL